MKRFHVHVTAVLAFLVLALSVVISACSEGGGGSSAAPADTKNIQLSGTIASGGSYKFGKVSKGKSFASVVETPIDSVVAIPMDRGSLDARNMLSSVRGTIGADGLIGSRLVVI